MQCSIRMDSDHNGGNVKMKSLNGYKNTYRKEQNLDNIIDQLATRLQDIRDQEGLPHIGMPTCSIEQTEAVRRYYAAFPALKKGEESPLQYYLPPPAWCRKPPSDNMQNESSMTKEWNIKSRKLANGRERRNSYHGQKKNKKRCTGFSRSFESKENLPEWMTHEGIWDMEAQDPVREFIRAIALDEGYGTCENTVVDESRAVVPDRDAGPPPLDHWPLDELEPRERTPLEDELYAKFEAKFDRSIEALWARDQNTPDDDYQELPIDFAELLSSPSDRMFDGAPTSPFGGGGPWAHSPPPPPLLPPLPPPPPRSPALHDRLRPLHLASPPPPELESFALYEGDDLYDALAVVASTVRSLTAINHSRDTSGFCEVPPRCRAPPPPAPAPRAAPTVPPLALEEDLLTSARTHFRPIRREPEAEAPRYADGDTFDICGELDVVEFRRSESGGSYLARERYLEYRAGGCGAEGARERTIDYGRLALTATQRRAPDAAAMAALPLRFPLRQLNAAVQTDGWGACDECAGAAKKMRPDAGVWSEPRACRTCAPPPPIAPPQPAAPAAPVAADELARDWEELLADISAAHAHYAGGGPGAAGAGTSGGGGPEEGGADRKRRHSAALRCARHCLHPHTRFLPCAPIHRPLTR